LDILTYFSLLDFVNINPLSFVIDYLEEADGVHFVDVGTCDGAGLFLVAVLAAGPAVPRLVDRAHDFVPSPLLKEAIFPCYRGRERHVNLL
jgi:hypothetical protein